LISSFGHAGDSGRAPTNWYDLRLGTVRTREAVTGMGVAPLAIADTFVDAIIKLELDSSRHRCAPRYDALFRLSRWASRLHVHA
jgi:hypothetical protein